MLPCALRTAVCYNAEFDGPAHEASTGMHTQLEVQLLHVAVYSAQREAQEIGHGRNGRFIHRAHQTAHEQILIGKAQARVQRQLLWGLIGNHGTKFSAPYVPP